MLLSNKRFAQLVTDAENGVTWSPEDSLLVADALKRAIHICRQRRTQLRGAQRALKNTSTRARQHRVEGDAAKAVETYRNGIRTTFQWLTGAHPALQEEE